MRRAKPDHTARWQAIAYLLAAVVAITNAAWFYNWRTRAVEHHQALTAAKAQEPERIVVYRDRPERDRPHAAALGDEERCMAGKVLRKIPNGWAGTGRSC